jgi:cytochrome b pre-mRNA-processing protein 3
MLHMYMLTARFRCFPSTISQIWTQQLLDHFFYDAEERMIQNHNMESRGIRNRYLKDLYVQWRGLLAAYDEGLVKGDVVLASAVWRNVFKGREDVDVRGLAAIVGYMRKGLMELDGLADQELMMGRWRVESPKEMCKLVAKRSELMDKEFTEEDEQAMQELVESAEEEEMQKRK